MYTLSITAIITCRNLHDYLAECVASIQAQTMRVSEIIIVHDACTPPPVFPNTTTLVRDTHRGVAATRNVGARIAISDNLLFVDADDVLEEYFIEAMIKTKEKTKADIIYPNVLIWSAWHHTVKLRNGWHEAAEEITMENMLEYNQIVISSLIPTALYEKVGGTPKYPILEDYAVWLQCVREGATFAKSPQSVLKYRQRENSRLHSNDELKNEFYYKIKERYTK